MRDDEQQTPTTERPVTNMRAENETFIARDRRCLGRAWPSAGARLVPVLFAVAACPRRFEVSETDGGSATTGQLTDDPTTLDAASTSRSSDSTDGPATGSGPTTSTQGDTSSTTADDGEPACLPPEHTPCDEGSPTPTQALGHCPGESDVQVTTMGPDAAIGTRGGFGSTAVFDPREGAHFVVIGSGFVGELDLETPAGDNSGDPTHCNDDLGAYDPGEQLPDPLRHQGVSAPGCARAPALIGEGDCSNTIDPLFSTAEDYVEVRHELDVPPGIVSFSHDLAFLAPTASAACSARHGDARDRGLSDSLRGRRDEQRKRRRHDRGREHDIDVRHERDEQRPADEHRDDGADDHGAADHREPLTTEPRTTSETAPDTDTGGGDACAPEPTDDARSTCSKGMCCDQLQVCRDNQDCDCLVDCLDKLGKGPAGIRTCEMPEHCDLDGVPPVAVELAACQSKMCKACF